VSSLHCALLTPPFLRSSRIVYLSLECETPEERVPVGVVIPPMSPEPTAPGTPGTPVSASDRSGPGPTVPWTRLVAFAFAYFAAALLTHVLSHGAGRIGRLWLPGGVFLGALLLTEMRTWAALDCGSRARIARV
jgi:hypothetical protein